MKQDTQRVPRAGGAFWAPLGAFAVYLLLLILAQRHLGAPSAEFGGTGLPDEPSHYLSGLMLHDYLAAGLPEWPMHYASRYYVHLPYFAVGYWPPVFYVAEALWMCVAGISRGHVLPLSAAMAALTATLLFAATRKTLGGLAALGVGFLFLLSPVVQQASMVLMTDMAVTLGSFAALLVLARYFDSGRTSDAIRFGLLAACTILTKSSGLFLGALPPLGLLLPGRLEWVRKFSFWAMPATVAAVCAPWFLYTRGLVSIGFSGIVKPSLHQLLALSGAALGHNFGWLLALSALGMFAALRRRPLRRLEILCILQPLCLLAFLLVSPVIVEARYLIAMFPPLMILAASGVSSLCQGRAPWAAQAWAAPVWAAPVAMLAAVLLAASAWLFRFPHPVSPNPVAPVAQFVAQHPYTAILVNPDAEGAMIAAIAALEPVRPDGRFLIRPGKLLARTNWMVTRYESPYRTPGEIQALLESIPVEAVILPRAQRPGALPHELLLEQTVRNAFPSKWRCVLDGGDYQLFEAVPKPPVSASAIERLLETAPGSRFSN